MVNDIKNMLEIARFELESETPPVTIQAAREIIRIERKYFYGDSASSKKLSDIREVITKVLK